MLTSSKKMEYAKRDWVVVNFVHKTMTACTFSQIQMGTGVPSHLLRRSLKRLVRSSRLSVRQQTFWNGMYYAKRFYYW